MSAEKTNAPKDPARSRLMAMQAVRVAGLVLVLLGAAVLAGKLDGPGWLGTGLFIAGAFDVLLFPKILARRWRSPRP
jgi:hypothetical protein